MQVVCEATQSPDTRVGNFYLKKKQDLVSLCVQYIVTRHYFIVIFQVRVAALQCLVKIMSLYYTYMEHYMGPALFAVSCCRKPFNVYQCNFKWDFCSVLATVIKNNKMLSLEIIKILYQITPILK